MLAQRTKAEFPVWENVFGNLWYNDPESTYGCVTASDKKAIKHSFRSAPAVNIKEDDASFTIEMAAPGKKKEDFSVSLDKSILTISSEKKEEKEEKQEKYTRREYSYTAFKRSFTLPETVSQDEISASYVDGILNVVIPKKEPKKPEVKTIMVS
jgi:HSP20 family protein